MSYDTMDHAGPDASTRRFPPGWLAQQIAISIDALEEIIAAYDRAGTPYTVSAGDVAGYRGNLSAAVSVDLIRRGSPCTEATNGADC